MAMNESLVAAGEDALQKVRKALQEGDPFDLLPLLERYTEELVANLKAQDRDEERIRALCKGLGRVVTDNVRFMDTPAAQAVARLTSAVAHEYGWRR